MTLMKRGKSGTHPESPEIDIVRAWHDALNAGKIDRLMATMHDDVEFGGPRGAGHGAALVRDWAERAGIQLAPERWFQKGDDVVVAQQARWRDQETGALGEPNALASVFQLRDGLVRRVTRHDSLDAALAAANLDASDEVGSTP